MIPTLSVGILTAPEVTIDFHGDFKGPDGTTITGKHRFKATELTEGALEFHPVLPHDSFTIHDVTIGVHFHWEQKEHQTFNGSLKLVVSDREPQLLHVINMIDVESYLLSVISSEMKSTANIPLLKAHAVISRSWVLAQLEGFNQLPGTAVATLAEEGDMIKWYDKDDHTQFNVCADDHCQRYQGISREITEKAQIAITETLGEVLTYEGKLADTRFHKCCGGVLERFATCWEDKHYPYLLSVRDTENDGTADFSGTAECSKTGEHAQTSEHYKTADYSNEEDATAFIEGHPASFCDTQDPDILDQVLNFYDRTTTDFYRWQVSYSAEELSELVRKKLGKDLGQITALEPLTRGPSSRISRLLIVGTKGEVVIGKELEIRRALSESHLYSSAFTVHTEGAKEKPERFTLHGAGWGHGVGLCQMGAAVMGEKGYSYREILSHYYPGTDLTKLYQHDEQ
ncbi:MAG: SpoIID/LytB domain-containing protein [Bacteroidota bacterium]|jgi:SpoIID/LytB domain protein|nr:SpoIID/LytB domain-containing protein [Bacteroidota bacterium]HHU97315.1 SpoIID/LytB domain-containing protein [Petrimonas sp.]